MHGEKLGHLNSGAPVFDRPNSHIHTEYQEVYKLISEVLQYVTEGHDGVFHYSHNFGSVIGESVCVETSVDSEIVYAQRPKRKGLSRFVKNVPLRPTSVFTVVLKRDKFTTQEHYILVTAYVGEKAPVEPWDTHADDYSREFWSNHALVWGSVPVLPGTETIMCPW